jgi:hypothetical protein
MRIEVCRLRLPVCRKCQSLSREFKLRVIRQMANARQRNILRYQTIKSKWTCCFKTEIHIIILSTQKRKYETKPYNENFAKKVRTCRLPFPETWSLNSRLISPPALPVCPFNSGHVWYESEINLFMSFNGQHVKHNNM